MCAAVFKKETAVIWVRIMKRICIIDYDMSVRGGVEQVTTSLANALCEQYEVYVLSLCLANGKCAYELSERVKLKILQKEGARIRHVLKNGFRDLRKFLKKEKIDCALTMGTYAGALASVMNIGGKTKLIFCDHGALMNQWKEKNTRCMRWIASKFSKRTVTLTDRSRRDYIKRFHTNPKKICRIYNWIDDEVVKMSGSYSTASHYILSAGRFGKEKGYDMLVEVAKKVLPKFPDWQWHLYGDGPTLPWVRDKIAEYGLEKQLILKGMVSDMYSRYKDYAVIVLPSYREGLPLVLLEGKANHLPEVSFDVMTGPGEIIQDGKDGFLIKPYDIEEMAEKLGQLMASEHLRQIFSENTGKKLPEFDKKRILKQWIQLIDNL